MSFVLITVLVLQSALYVTAQADYCKLSCQGEPNSACDCGFKNCPGDVKLVEMKDNIRQAAEEAHNSFREKFASGQAAEMKVKVSDMMALEYDNDLEHTAECMNKRCTFGHDSCRITEKFKDQGVGQNLYMSAGKGCDPKAALNSATESWFSEIKDASADCMGSFGSCASGQPIGHFTQMIWSKTNAVGCSVIEYGGTCQVVCNYGPAGNVMTQPVYTPGDPGAECKFKHSTFQSLCTPTEHKDKWGKTDARGGSGSERIRGIGMANLQAALLSLIVWILYT